MNAKTTKTLFVFIISLFAVAVIVFGVLVAVQYHLGKKNAQRDFRAVLNNTASVFRQAANDSAAIKQGMENVFASHENLAAIIIHVDNAPVFAQQTSIGFISLSANNVPIITASSPMLLTLSAAVNVADGKPALASAAFYMLRPKSVYNAARISFLIILAATVIAILFVLVNQFTEQPAKEEKSAEEESVPPSAQETSVRQSSAQAPEPEEIAVDKQEHTTQEAEPQEVKPEAPSQAQEIPPQEITQPVAAQSAPENIPNDIDNEQDIERRRNVAVPEKIPNDQDSISPATGFTKESFLVPRLEAELERATKLELDVALFIILLPGLNASDAAEISKLITRQFRFSDDIFEYKSTSIAAIVLNYSIDDSLKQAERLYVKLTEALESMPLELKFGIGVSNRTFRIISSERLIGEADEAAHRALENPETPVVALKIDPVKYREYLSQSKRPAIETEQDTH